MERYERAEELLDQMLKDVQVLSSTEFNIGPTQYEQLKARIDLIRGYLNKAQISLSN